VATSKQPPVLKHAVLLRHDEVGKAKSWLQMCQTWRACTHWTSVSSSWLQTKQGSSCNPCLNLRSDVHIRCC
jgi:hypothetical protein